jgi:poly(3-hydroxybutyrate) depolymerase
MRHALLADSSQEYFVYEPARGGKDAPVFVSVHGISRNVEEHATLFAPYAEAQGAVLVAPFFTRDGSTDYQRLGRDRSGRRADAALDAILAEVAAATGARTDRFYLFGFSGGAQFAHRYTLAHPERIVHAAMGAAGWYTFPDRRRSYPFGLGPSKDHPGLRFDPAKFLRVPMTVLVGEADTGTVHLRRGVRIDGQQGSTRLARAQNWVAAMRRAAQRRRLTPLVTCQQVPGIEHSFKQFMDEGELGERVFAAMFGSQPSAARQP